MNVKFPSKRPYVGHAIQVSLIATLLIMVTYVVLVLSFNIIERHHLFEHVDSRLSQRLNQIARDPRSAATIANEDNARDFDDASVFLWVVTAEGNLTSLSTGSPQLGPRSVPHGQETSIAVLDGQSFRLEALQVDGKIYIDGQSLAEVDHVERDLRNLELLAGPVLVIAVYLGTLLIGLKAAKPVEAVRRRQLEFTADASHELRTPLSVIEAEVSLALGTNREAAEYRETLTRVSRESSRLRAIVEDLLWLSRFDAEPSPPGVEPVDLYTIAQICVNRFEVIAARRNIHLSMRPASTSNSRISAAPELIDRLAGVLIDNACRYARAGGTVSVSVSSQSNWVSLSVDDDGPGISELNPKDLFNRFHRATDVGNGAGLGLSIGDTVVRVTGGKWNIAASPLGGAHMEVRWPRAAGPTSVD